MPLRLGGPEAPGGSAREDVSQQAGEFREFTLAHQSWCLQAATLVSGTEAAGRAAALTALAALARAWPRAREEGPEAVLRPILFRDALAGAVAPSPPREDPTALAGGQTAAMWGRDPEALEEARRALGELPARTRAVAVLRLLDERGEGEVADTLGITEEQVRRGTERAATRLAAALPHIDPAVAPAGEELRELLADLAETVPQESLAREAWDRARHRTRVVRRRALLGGGLAFAGAGAAVAVREGPVPEPSPSPSSSPPPSDGAGPRAAVVEGVRVLLAPEPGAEQLLPLYPDAPSLALPEVLGPGLARAMRPLPLEGTQRSVRAAYVTRIAADRFSLAVYVPGENASALAVAGSPLVPVGGPEVSMTPVLGPRSIDDDRHRVAVAQPGAVVVVDVRRARTRRIPVPDQDLATAGWAHDGRTVVARGGAKDWLVDTESESATEADRPVAAGWADLHRAGSATVLRSFSGSGVLTGERALRGPAVTPYGPSVANTEGWACSGAFLDRAYAGAIGRSQGLAAIQGDVRLTPRVLAASSGFDVPRPAYRPLAWGPRDTVLLESFSSAGPADPPVRRVLAWDVIGERLYRVADLVPTSPGTNQAYTGSWAL